MTAVDVRAALSGAAPEQAFGVALDLETAHASEQQELDRYSETVPSRVRARQRVRLNLRRKHRRIDLDAQ